MKKVLTLLFVCFAGMMILSSCGDDKTCYTCEITVLFPVESSFCDDGDMTTVTTTVLGISVDTTVNVSAEAYASTLETQGYSCSKD
ncbi:MAG: hypothetical protein HKN92_06220 [Chitinophagales bacterium]|nr:hypothetical protein [Chitinophagales bacterium]